MQIAFESLKQKICKGEQQNFAKVEDKILNSNSGTLRSQGCLCWDVGVPCSVGSALYKINVLTFLFY